MVNKVRPKSSSLETELIACLQDIITQCPDSAIQDSLNSYILKLKKYATERDHQVVLGFIALMSNHFNTSAVTTNPKLLALKNVCQAQVNLVERSQVASRPQPS